MSKSKKWWATRERWDETAARAALDALESSELDPEAFARQHGFNGQRLRNWSARLGVALPGRQRTSASSSLVPLVVKGTDTHSDWTVGDAGTSLRVRVGRAIVEVDEPERLDATWLARLIRELGGAQ
jgi:hypothetical protein